MSPARLYRLQGSAGATLLVASLSAPLGEPAAWRSCSDAGSGLPWWTPLGVTGLLMLISAIYRFRHRPKPPIETSPQLHPDIEPLTNCGNDETPPANLWTMVPE